MTALRWILLLPAIALVCALVWLAAQAIVGWADGRCPADQMVAAVCVAPWHTTVLDGLIYGGMAALAVGVVLMAAVVAPRFQFAMAIIALLLLLAPLIAAIVFTQLLDTPVPVPIGNLPDHILNLALLTALLGAACVWWVSKWRTS